MDRYAVIGNPIAHSKSPQIHAAFARQTGQELSYEALLAPVDGFAQTVADFRARGGRGLNVTVPFKLEAFALAERHTPRAQAGEDFSARLTIDVTADMRGRIKIAAFQRGQTVTDMLRVLFEREFPPPSGERL